VADGVEVYADVTRRLPAVDPRGRAMHISVGAAILNLRLAIRHSGRWAALALLPDPSQPLHVATVRLGGPCPVEEDDRTLYAAIARRRSNRGPFEDRVPAEVELAALESAAREEDAVLGIADARGRDTVLSLARTAAHRMREQFAYRDELRRWTTDDPYRDDGVSIETVGPLSERTALPLRDFAADREIPDRLTVEFEREPTLATLWTSADTPRDWLVAGAALERVMLEATRRGIETCLITQPLEDPSLRDLLADEGLIPQAVVRIGYGPPAPPSNRRPVDEILLPA
jgi:nitroreductase